MKTLAERFADKTETDPTTGCQLWQGATSGGRGVMCVDGKTRLATHVAYKIATGVDLPRGSSITPQCGQRSCVNVAHLEIGRRRKVSIADRLAAKTVVDAETGCHLYRGAANSYGHGRIAIGRTHKIASRVAYELVHGPIPDGQIVRHRCDTPACVNPDHLELGTHLDNQHDRAERGRTDRGRFLVPQMTKRDRATMLASFEVGYRWADLRDGWALSSSGTTQALAKARRERAAATASHA